MFEGGHSRFTHVTYAAVKHEGTQMHVSYACLDECTTDVEFFQLRLDSTPQNRTKHRSISRKFTIFPFPILLLSIFSSLRVVLLDTPCRGGH